MAALDITKKLLIYHTLYGLNLSFSNIVTRCAKLQDAGIFTRKSMQLYQGLTQELQAEINQFLVGRIHSIELGDWAHFGKTRQAEEKRLRDPDDVLIDAEERRRELADKRRK